MNPYMISAFNDEMDKIAGAARVRRIADSMAKKLRRSADLTKQIEAERSLFSDLRAQKNELTRSMDALEGARRRADEKLVRRANQYDVKQRRTSVAPTTYTQRTLGGDPPKSLREATPTLDRMGGYWFAKADTLTRRADEFRETADVLRNVQRSGPAKRRSFLDVYLSRPIVGTGVPARPPKPKQDHLLTSAKREVDDALKAAERQYIEDMRRARKQVYDDSLEGRLARIRTLAQQRQ